MSSVSELDVPPSPRQSFDDSSGSSRESSEDDSSGTNVSPVWDESFTQEQQVAVSTMAPNLLVLKNPFRALLLVCLVTVVTVGLVAWVVATDCSYVAPFMRRATLGQLRKVLFRGKPPGVPVNWPEDYGDPYCVSKFSDPSWRHNNGSYTLRRPFRDQVANVTNYHSEWHTCMPTPYADGTPHYLEVLWQEATGQPHINFCNEIFVQGLGQFGPVGLGSPVSVSLNLNLSDVL